MWVIISSGMPLGHFFHGKSLKVISFNILTKNFAPINESMAEKMTDCKTSKRLWRLNNHGTMIMMNSHYTYTSNEKQNSYQITTNWMKVAPPTNVH